MALEVTDRCLSGGLLRRDQSWNAYQGKVAWCKPETKQTRAVKLGLDLHPKEQGLPIPRSRGEAHNPRPLGGGLSVFHADPAAAGHPPFGRLPGAEQHFSIGRSRPVNA